MLSSHQHTPCSPPTSTHHAFLTHPPLGATSQVSAAHSRGVHGHEVLTHDRHVRELLWAMAGSSFGRAQGGTGTKEILRRLYALMDGQPIPAR